MCTGGNEALPPRGQTPHPAAEQLRAYALGRLPRAEWAAVEAHLQTCDRCWECIEETSRADPFVQLLQSVATQPSPCGVGLAVRLPSSIQPEAELRALLAHHPRYELLQRIGRGGMGEVWLARHRLMQRLVALKVLSGRLLGSPAAATRFQREVRAAARLDHPNIVRAYDAEQVGDLHFLVMEYVEGIDLARLVRARGPLPVADSCAYVRQAALGVQHAASQGIIHRDLKPSNLMRTPVGQIKILDFGLASVRSDLGEPLTSYGEFLGTPGYLSPEQALDARQVDVRADLYALGSTLFSLLTGRQPCAVPALGGSVALLGTLRPEVPPALVGIVARMLAPDPAQRFQTPAEVVAALAPFAEPAGGRIAVKESRGPRPARSCVLGAVVFLLLGGAVFTALLGRSQGPLPDGAKEAAPPVLAPEARITNSLGMVFALVPAGSFRMGAPESDSLAFPPERPPRRVTISRPFYLGVYEVTQGQYEQVMGKNPSQFHADNGGSRDHPVEKVSWVDAMEFCRRLSERPAERDAGRIYRLPTEAEWEYACRAGKETRYSFGDDPADLAHNAWFQGNAQGRTHPVGRFPPNAWGLCDMHGNVWEWCADLFDPDYYQYGPATDPPGALKADRRVLRGGSWYNNGQWCRASSRASFSATVREPYVGFRVALTPPERQP